MRRYPRALSVTDYRSKHCTTDTCFVTCSYIFDKGISLISRFQKYNHLLQLIIFSNLNLIIYVVRIIALGVHINSRFS